MICIFEDIIVDVYVYVDLFYMKIYKQRLYIFIVYLWLCSINGNDKYFLKQKNIDFIIGLINNI